MPPRSASGGAASRWRSRHVPSTVPARPQWCRRLASGDRTVTRCCPGAQAWMWSRCSKGGGHTSLRLVVCGKAGATGTRLADYGGRAGSSFPPMGRPALCACAAFGAPWGAALMEAIVGDRPRHHRGHAGGRPEGARAPGRAHAGPVAGTHPVAPGGQCRRRRRVLQVPGDPAPQPRVARRGHARMARWQDRPRHRRNGVRGLDGHAPDCALPAPAADLSVARGHRRLAPCGRGRVRPGGRPGRARGGVRARRDQAGRAVPRGGPARPRPRRA